MDAPLAATRGRYVTKEEAVQKCKLPLLHPISRLRYFLPGEHPARASKQTSRILIRSQQRRLYALVDCSGWLNMRPQSSPK